MDSRANTMFVKGESPSFKLAGPRYVVLGVDPLEDPAQVYVDIEVSRLAGEPHEEWECVFQSLKQLGPWRKGNNMTPRQRYINTSTFLNREQPAEVDIPSWQENVNRFARRLTLKSLVDILKKTVCDTSLLFNDIFEIPEELTGSGPTSSALRSRISNNTLFLWFMALDTYSKCIIFLESVMRFLQAKAAPIRLAIDDIFCDLFTQLIRPTFVTYVKKTTSPDRTLSPTCDIKLLPVTQCVNNFLLKSIDVLPSSTLCSDYVRSNIPPFAVEGEFMDGQGYDDILKLVCNRNDVYESSDSDESEISTNSVKRKRNMHANDVIKRARNNIVAYTMIEGYNDNTISPINVYYRTEPIITSSHNYLLFPFIDDDSEHVEENILFFVKIKQDAAVSLLLPGLFRHKQFLTGTCQNMPSSRRTTQESEKKVWRYTLADYSPMRSCTDKDMCLRNELDIGTKTLNSRLVDVRRLFL
uniref:Capsid protein n=1 Tax=Chionoecetes opilio bacilliform virus TaxID=1825681 RepID=A0A1Q3DL72_9VIRU|nr:capsid protein [Chionoecetes opilio bacilliform virus]